jgi:hypothetical protein
MGNSLARGSAVENLVESAARAFQGELRKISSSLRIDDDRSVDIPAPVSFGEVTIEASVANADVIVDGKFVGSAPPNITNSPQVSTRLVRAAGHARGSAHSPSSVAPSRVLLPRLRRLHSGRNLSLTLACSGVSRSLAVGCSAVVVVLLSVGIGLLGGLLKSRMLARRRATPN